MIEIGITKGYKMVYDQKEQKFLLQDADGNEVASALTQAALEGKAEKLAKQSFKLPIAAVLPREVSVDKGRITSVNVDNRSVYFVEDDQYHTRTKIRFPYGPKVFELTEANKQICTQIEELKNQREELAARIKALIQQFEKPINLEYFGIKHTQ